jgi:hypothetical protein
LIVEILNLCGIENVVLEVFFAISGSQLTGVDPTRAEYDHTNVETAFAEK